MKLHSVAILAAGSLLSACDAGDDNRIVGQLESDRVEITAEVQEVITAKIVAEGQAVVVGEALMQQDTDRIEAAIVEAQAVLGQYQARLDELIRGPRKEQIVAAQANVAGALDNVAYRRREFERAQELFDRELASPTLRDRTLADLDAANSRLEVEQAKLEEYLTGTTIEELNQAEQAVRQGEARIASLVIDRERHHSVAPVAGVIDSILFEPGERPGPGQPLLVKLAGGQPYARGYIPTSLRATTIPGMSARVFVDGIAGPFNGRVRWVSSEAAFTPYFALTEHDRGRLSFLAKVDILDADDRLPDGVPVEVELLR
jgi:HlyD family secretion protein